MRPVYPVKSLFFFVFSFCNAASPRLQVPNHTLVWLCACVTVIITLFLLIQRSPVTYYIYCLLPIPIWYSVLKE